MGRESSMNTKEFFVHDGSEGQRIERLHHRQIKGEAIFVETLLLKVKIVGEVSAFMVSPQKMNLFRVVQFPSPKVHHYLASKHPSVHIISLIKKKSNIYYRKML